ncbi:protein of unknown function [Franzmannia pantelleriensis]|uniref:DUF4401 domain-containing protein n=1 Tax=Franzmannia pantelleriensis TaxID=48727 RepID=A0A1G9PBR1_9GAMM|nr:DUF4401 domain-containing protein [Halomonas pantelleriensis]SDL95921.1 protein of unknown function [Halomonas pantelleriensis]
MTHSLKQRLEQAGIEVADSQVAPAIESPWFVRALQAFSGWLAALFLLGFIGMGMVFVFESSIAAAGLGLVMIAGAYALLRGNGGDFLEHLALAASLTGQLLVAWALADVLMSHTARLWWALLPLQVLLALIMPSLTHRCVSALAACLALYLALIESSAATSLASGLVLLVATALWLNEFRWPAYLRQCQALGYGLLLGLLAIQVMAYAGRSPFMFRHHDSEVLAWLAPWGGDALATLALLILLWHVFKRHAQARMPGVRLAAYGAAVVLMLLSWQAHGLSQGAVVIALGFAIGNRLIIGLGVILLLLASANYYYWLEVTLLVKAVTLCVLGVVLLTLRWMLRRWWRSPPRGEMEGGQ